MGFRHNQNKKKTNFKDTIWEGSTSVTQKELDEFLSKYPFSGFHHEGDGYGVASCYRRLKDGRIVRNVYY